MKLEQMITALREEKQRGIASRFPCRAIMTSSLKQYKAVIEALNKFCDGEVDSDALFSGADVLPNYEALNETAYENRWLVLTGVSEYLRLFRDSEARLNRFGNLWRHMRGGDNTGRVLIVLWNCEALWYDRSLNLAVDERQQDFIYKLDEDDTTDPVMNVEVLSADFEAYIDRLAAQGTLLIGIREWYEYWMFPNAIHPDHCLLTRRARNIRDIQGEVNIQVIRSTLDFIRGNLSDGMALNEDNCPKEAQALLFESARNARNVDDALLSALNIRSFDGDAIMAMWRTLAPGKRQLARLWLARHPEDSYLCHCFSVTKSDEELETHILSDIFSARLTHPQWVDQAQELIENMKLEKNNAFFEQLDGLPTFEERLGFLSGRTVAERQYVLRMVGAWLRVDAAQVLGNERLMEIYPELEAYLDRPEGLYSDGLALYDSWYKSYKLSNRLPDAPDDWLHSIRKSDYKYRFGVLKQFCDADTAVLWVDALGFEWLPLACWSIERRCNGKLVHREVVQAQLPTETCYNQQWLQMDIPYRKLDKLDKLAHKGVIDDPDYYSCVEEQIAFVASLSSAVNELLNEHQRVIITGDHGTSRLAARFFHKQNGMTPPKGAQVLGHGRYCRLDKDSGIAFENVERAKDAEGKEYLVFSNYDHFKQGGFAAGSDDDNAIYGEVHGGASPEELLVPVLVIEAAMPAKLSAKWDSDTVKIKMKKVRTDIRFNKPVQTLQVKLDAQEAQCEPADNGRTWHIVVRGVKPGTYHVVVVADGMLVDVNAPLAVLPALGGGEGDLP